MKVAADVESQERRPPQEVLAPLRLGLEVVWWSSPARDQGGGYPLCCHVAEDTIADGFHPVIWYVPNSSSDGVARVWENPRPSPVGPGRPRADMAAVVACFAWLYPSAMTCSNNSDLTSCRTRDAMACRSHPEEAPCWVRWNLQGGDLFPLQTLELSSSNSWGFGKKEFRLAAACRLLAPGGSGLPEPE
jgi:hypothetical protein